MHCLCGSLLVSISVCALFITDTLSVDAFPLDGTESSWGTELGYRELACSELVINSFKHNHPQGEQVPLVPQYTEEENEAIEHGCSFAAHCRGSDVCRTLTLSLLR